MYSTAEMVEVFVNDQSVGVQKGSTEKGKSTVFTWNDVVLLQNQANTVKAVATFADGSQKEDSVTWTGIGE